ncbi:hypothetical protein MH117_09975 [Paenibacillus sp. ACRRX]|uniref:hypothetical protein n=1 Tax=Paenibacillus sp. ACRRX TaxID=2918206 RepID=UPI001EF4508D|nr:hypothetical protein [Paenibacillus sp. ACRRX]MCG7407751.1 hypothetical protein [Paenibacillus sp. ACRRX]
MTNGQLADAIQGATGLDQRTAMTAAHAVIDELRKNGEIVVEKRMYDSMMNRILGGGWR